MSVDLKTVDPDKKLNAVATQIGHLMWENLIRNTRNIVVDGTKDSLDTSYSEKSDQYFVAFGRVTKKGEDNKLYSVVFVTRGRTKTELRNNFMSECEIAITRTNVQCNWCVPNTINVSSRFVSNVYIPDRLSDGVVKVSLYKFMLKYEETEHTNNVQALAFGQTCKDCPICSSNVTLFQT